MKERERERERKRKREREKEKERERERENSVFVSRAACLTLWPIQFLGIPMVTWKQRSQNYG